MGSTILLVIQVAISLILVVLILIQAKGAGLGSPFGGAFLSSYSTKRGVEKVVFKLTIVLAALFLLSSVTQLIFG